MQDTLIVVRHGQTQGNLDDPFTGWRRHAIGVDGSPAAAVREERRREGDLLV